MNIKMHILAIVLGVLLYIPTVSALNPIHSTKAFNFKNTVLYAIAHSPTLDFLRKSLNISKLNRKNNLATFLPNIDVTSTHIVGKDPAEDNSNAASSLGIEATENLYNNGENFTNYKKTKLQQAITLLQYQQGRDQLIKTVVTDFLNLSLQQKLSAIQRTNVSILQQQYHAALEQYHQGLKTPEDVIRFRSQMQQAKISLLQANNAIKQSKQQLLTDMGYKYGTTKFISLQLSPIKVSSLPIQLPDLRQQYQYKIILLQREVNKLDINLQQRKYWPQVNVKASANYGNELQPGIVDSFGRKKQLDWQAELELKYKILDWGTQRRDIAIATQTGWQNIDNLTQQLLSERQDIDNLMSGLKLHKQSYKISTSLRRSETKNYSTLNQSYRAGKVSYLDLTTAISDLSAAKVQYITDRYALEKDLYAYYYYKGMIYDKVFK